MHDLHRSHNTPDTTPNKKKIDQPRPRHVRSDADPVGLLGPKKKIASLSCPEVDSIEVFSKFKPKERKKGANFERVS
jgi:hypothetical protein